jgi:hypothetical protein
MRHGGVLTFRLKCVIFWLNKFYEMDDGECRGIASNSKEALFRVRCRFTIYQRYKDNKNCTHSGYRKSKTNPKKLKSRFRFSDNVKTAICPASVPILDGWRQLSGQRTEFGRLA